MSIYEIITILISFFSIFVSIAAVFVAYIPYRKKIIFKVRLNPFIKDKDDFEIEFLIINKSDKDLFIKALGATKSLDLQVFDKKAYPKKIKSNSSRDFSINNSFLKFEIFNISKDNKPPKYIKFYFIDSIRNTIASKVKYKDYINVSEIYRLRKLQEEGHIKEDIVNPLAKEMLYFLNKNKSSR